MGNSFSEINVQFSQRGSRSTNDCSCWVCITHWYSIKLQLKEKYKLETILRIFVQLKTTCCKVYRGSMWTVMQWVEMLPRSARVPGLILTVGAVYVEFSRSHYDCVGFLWVLGFLPHPKDIGYLAIVKSGCESGIA